MENKTRFSIRAEWILLAAALLAAALFGWMTLQCVPLMIAEQMVVEAPTEPSVENGPMPILETVPPSEETQPETIPPAPNPYSKRDFQYNDNNYLLLQTADSYAGVDVSAFQGEIDWQQVADSGIRFAIIRLGYRGWGKAGKMVVDEYAKANLEGARAAGLQVGAYFFSQALNIMEVDQEIDFMLKILGDYQLDMPLILDWEIPVPEARTASMDMQTLTEMQLHFSAVMEEKGYDTMIYFNWNMSRNLLHLSELEEMPFWLALYQDRMTYPYHVEMWQYTDKGQVPGIQGNVDINVYMP